MSKRLLLIRHAATAQNFAGCYIGSSDVPVAQEQLSEIRLSLAKKVVEFEPHRCFCSPMQRTFKTAEILLEKTDVSIEFDERLREISFGKWEGMNFQEIATQYPELIQQWSESPLKFGFPGGEKIEMFNERIYAVADSFINYPEDNLLVVTHGGVIRTMICHFLGLSALDYLKFVVQPGTLTVIDIEKGGGCLSALNLR